MLQKKIIIFATNFPPQVGGGANYSLHLAQCLHNIGALSYLLTSKFQKRKFSYDVSSQKFIRTEQSLDKLLLFRKSRSLIYRLRIFGYLIWEVVKIKLFHSNKIVIITSFYTSIDLQILSLFVFFRIKYIPVLHRLDILTLSKHRVMLNKILFKSFDVIVISDFTKSLLSNNSNIKFKDAPPIYPTFDKNYFDRITIRSIEDLEESLSIQLKDKLILITVCRLVNRKGVNIAINAFIKSTIAQENCVYLIIGDGPEFMNLQTLIKSSNADNIFLLGHCDEQTKFSLLSHSDAFIMPNHTDGQTDAEGFGISFVEASYFKNLVIGGKSRGAVEAVKDGYSGYLFDFDSNEALDRLINLLNSLTKNTTSKIGENGKKYVLKNFELQIIQHRLEQMVSDY